MTKRADPRGSARFIMKKNRIGDVMRTPET